MMENIEIHENGILLKFGVTEENHLVLSGVLPEGGGQSEDAGTDVREFSPVEVIVTGENCPEDRLGNKLVHSSLGVRLRFERYERIAKQDGCLYVFYLKDADTGLCVELHYQFYDGISVFTCHTEVYNAGSSRQGLEAVSSFSLHGFERNGNTPYDERYRLHIIHNGWQKELQWRSYRLPELGLVSSQERGRYNSSKMISISNTGSWSAKEYIPMGILEDEEKQSCLAWQIEHNGSWHWEIAEHAGMLYLKICGPMELYAHWYKELAPGERFASVPAAICCAEGTAQDAVRELTRYRRRIRRENEDNKRLPVIFNDYMNCLWGDPTTEKELPLIDMAADLGCEYYCIDCGWYSAGAWWDSVGEWMPSEERFPVTPQFPKGLVSLLSYIRSRNMVPGLWLELEAMGLNCPLAKEKPDDWFFMRHGKRVREKTRYQLNFSNPQVRAFADSVIQRLVEDYGVGYIKMDYNIEAGIGTDCSADSPGDGLLEHNRAYLQWLDHIFARYPDLVIENCGSGGMRMDYAMLKRHSIQSTSDMEDYRTYAAIAVNAPLALTPEQAAVWSYPLTPDSEEETIYNMVNTLFLRVHQSGHLFRLSEACQGYMKEAIAWYKETRDDRRDALPFWPLGFADYADEWFCIGMEGKRASYVAVWRKAGKEDTCVVPLPKYRGRMLRIVCAYPLKKPVETIWNMEEGTMTVRFMETGMARIFMLKF